LPHFFAINRAKRAKNAQSEVARTGHSAGHRRALDRRAHKKYDNNIRDKQRREEEKEAPNGLEKSSNVGTPLLETSKESSEVNVRIFQPMSK